MPAKIDQAKKNPAIRAEGDNRPDLYLSALYSPRAWLGVAQRLRLAAEKIDIFQLKDVKSAILNYDKLKTADREKFHQLWDLFPIRQFLMGRAFENLIKGVIIAEEISVTNEKGELVDWFRHHDIDRLLVRLDTSNFTLTEEEERLLREFKRYVKWSGSYPVPVKSPEYLRRLSTSELQNRKQLKLWDRLEDYIKNAKAESALQEIRKQRQTEDQ
jgi:hypothetical protein